MSELADAMEGIPIPLDTRLRYVICILLGFRNLEYQTVFSNLELADAMNEWILECDSFSGVSDCDFLSSEHLSELADAMMGKQTP